jgi:exonuclease VII small subunit
LEKTKYKQYKKEIENLINKIETGPQKDIETAIKELAIKM